jgi:RHS repeat-associated protein
MVRQVLPSSGGSAGGSGIYLFGSYLVQVLDANGQLAGLGLRQPVDVKLNVGGRAAGMNVQRAVAVFNQPLPAWFDARPSGAQVPASSARTRAPVTPVGPAHIALGPLMKQRATADPSGHTLSTTASLSGPSTAVSWETNVQVATWGKPDIFEAGLSSGSLTASVPIDVPQGPGGLTPPLNLAYDSAAINDQHNPQGAAPWVGEGWNMSLGAISWAEHNVAPPSTCDPAKTTCPSWADTWQLSDPLGTAAELIPPTMETKTFNDDSPFAITPSPVTWHTAPETHARVISFLSTNTVAGATVPCFRLFEPTGMMEEFGCTSTSLQYYLQPSGSNAGVPFIANWLLDMIVDPQGNQIHVSYQQDVVAGTGGGLYDRDSQLAAVEWDSPGCHDVQSACTGSAWAPLMRAGFNATHAVAHVQGSSCAANGSLRCDDPVDLSGSSGLGAPTVQSTFVLNDILVQVRSNGGASWNTLKDYELAYDQSGPTRVTDTFSGFPQSTAGKLNLTQIRILGADGSATLPTRAFGYTRETSFYEDSLFNPTPTSNCGPSWNTGYGSGCLLWSQSYDGNSWFLSTASNGQGLTQSFEWQDARNNTSMLGGDLPFQCDDPNNQSTVLCRAPDNQAWSRIVLTKSTGSTISPSQSGQGGAIVNTSVTGTTTYAYVLPYWLDGCDICSGLYWRSVMDSDRADYYNSRFTSFLEVDVQHPDGSGDAYGFYTTEGVGVYDSSQVTCNGSHWPYGESVCGSVPWSDLNNVAHGREKFDFHSSPDGNLMAYRLTHWRAVCPPVGVTGSPAKPGYGTQGGNLVSELDQGTNPVMVCDVQKVRVDEVTEEGLRSAPNPDQVTTYAYDDLGRQTSQTRTRSATIADTGVGEAANAFNGLEAVASDGVVRGAPGLVSGDPDMAMTFDGKSGEIDTRYIETNATAYSVEAWIRTTDSGVNRAIVENRGGGIGSGPGGSLTLGLDFATTNAPGAPFFMLDSDGTAIGIWSPKAINDGQPHHVVGTWSGPSGTAVAPSQFTLYVDGVPVPTNQINVGSSSSPLTGFYSYIDGLETKIAHHDAWNTNLSGTLGKIAIYTSALTAARVQTHFSAGAGYNQAVKADSPAAYWRLNDAAPSPTIVNKVAYVGNDSVSTTGTSASGVYIVDRQALTDTEDSSGSRLTCAYTSYDGQGFKVGQTSGLIHGLTTTSDRYTNCGVAPSFTPSGQIRTTRTYDIFGNELTTSDPEANAGNTAHQGCAAGSSTFSSCATYDGTFAALPTAETNALNQTTRTAYSSGSPIATPAGPITSGYAGKCVDDAGNGTSNGTRVQLWDCNGNPAQSWTVSPNNTVQINGRCLDITAFGTANGTLVQLWTCTGASNQTWTASNGSLVNPISGRCLDGTNSSANSTQLQIWDCNSNPQQQWTPAGGSIADSSGAGNQAQWSGGVAFQEPGNTGTDGDPSLGFDGSKSAVTLPGALTSTFENHDFSVEQWAYFTDSNTVDRPLFAAGVAATDQNLHLLRRNNVAFFGMYFDDLTGTTTLTPNQWWHLVFTWSASTKQQTIYVNGAVDGQRTTTGSLNVPATSSATVGRWMAGNLSMTGRLGQTAVYGSVLPASRVQAHFSAGGGYKSAVLADAPLGFYRLDDAGALVQDSSGNDNRAQWAGEVGFQEPGFTGIEGDPAMGFDGASASVPVPGKLTPNFQNHDFSVEVWAYFTDSSAADRPLFSIGQPGTDQYLHLLRRNNVALFGFFSDDLGGATTLSPNQWWHLVFTWSAATKQRTIYVNGAVDAQGSSSGSLNVPFWSVGQVGRWPATAQSMVGRLGQAAIYGSALSASRVQAHFSAGTNYSNVVGADGPLAYYHLDDLDGMKSASSGLGLWPASTTDANGQTTSYTYDALGREIARTLPGEGGGLTTVDTAYTVWCSGTAAQAPCVEVDKTQRLNGTTTVTARAFYDGLGHLVETRTPGSGGQDVVRYSFYDKAARLAFQSVPYLVSAYTGAPGSAAFSVPDSTQAGTSYTYDALGRTLTTKDALSSTTSKSYTVACGAAGTNDTACYEQTLTTDANGHRSGTLVDALGRTTYEQRYTGSSSANYAVYATAKYTYDLAGNLTQILHPNDTTATSFTYDNAGRKTGMTDPDRGSEMYNYDQDGNLVQSMDARGSAGTVFMGYDGLDRPIWRNTSNSSTGAYQTFTYDSTAGGNVGVGRLTSESFTNGTIGGSRTYAYDGRGQQTSSMLTVGSTSYPLSSTYDDVGNLVTQVYPTGETVTNAYTSMGWLSGVSTKQGSTTTPRASNIAYAGMGGAYGEMTSANLSGTTYLYSASYDVLGRATDTNVKRTSDNGVIFDQSRGFDAVGNVTTESMTLPAGTDNQSFCYDEQDRLTWAGATGTPPCTGTAIGGGTLSAAQYAQSFTYDAMGRLTSGPLGTYAYGDPAHVHGATGAGTSYTSSYDAAGDMTCRAATTASTCTGGSPTGARLSYNNQGQLATWQNTPTSPTTTAGFLYDGASQRVAQQVTQGGATTTTVYVGGVEEAATSGSTTTTTIYYTANGKRIALGVNGAISYMASDALGSAMVAFGINGTATASVLYSPYGGVRYSAGTMPTTYGFTGQRQDAASGLDYYGARYYDPALGQFVSADTVLQGKGLDLSGLSRYAYVGGNPENRTDPTGNRFMCGDQVCSQDRDGMGPLGSGSSLDRARARQQMMAYLRRLQMWIDQQQRALDALMRQHRDGSGRSGSSNPGPVERGRVRLHWSDVGRA